MAFDFGLTLQLPVQLMDFKCMETTMRDLPVASVFSSDIFGNVGVPPKPTAEADSSSPSYAVFQQAEKQKELNDWWQQVCGRTPGRGDACHEV